MGVLPEGWNIPKWVAAYPTNKPQDYVEAVEWNRRWILTPEQSEWSQIQLQYLIAGDTGASAITCIAPDGHEEILTVQDYLDYLNQALIDHKNQAVLDHPDGSVTTAKLADTSVTEAKMADLAVGTRSLKDLSVTHAKLAEDSVTTENIVNGTIELEDLSDAVKSQFGEAFATTETSVSPTTRKVSLIGITSYDQLKDVVLWIRSRDVGNLYPNQAPTLEVNALGAKPIRMPMYNPTDTYKNSRTRTWTAAGAVYGVCWDVDNQWFALISPMYNYPSWLSREIDGRQPGLVAYTDRASDFSSQSESVTHVEYKGYSSAGTAFFNPNDAYYDSVVYLPSVAVSTNPNFPEHYYGTASRDVRTETRGGIAYNNVARAVQFASRHNDPQTWVRFFNGTWTEGTLTNRTVTGTWTDWVLHNNNGDMLQADYANGSGKANPNKVDNSEYASTAGLAESVSQSIIDSITAAVIASSFDINYPVGTIHMTAKEGNPGTWSGWKGTWIRWGKGRVPVSLNEDSVLFDTSEKEGGANDVSLSISQMPSHTHLQEPHRHVRAPYNATAGQVYDPSYWIGVAQGAGVIPAYTQDTTAVNKETGGGLAHNNVQEYIVCYMWKRVQ